MVSARVLFCLLARGSGAGGDTGGISGRISPCTMLHGMKREFFDDNGHGDCTGTVSTSALIWDRCKSEMTTDGDSVTWKSYKSYAEMQANGTFVYRVEEPYSGKGCEDDKKGKAATPVAMDKCVSGSKFQYTSHCGKFLKYAEFSGDGEETCDDTKDHREGFVIPVGTCFWDGDDGEQCPDRTAPCEPEDRVPMQRFKTVECDSSKVCTVMSFSDSMCKIKHEYWADFDFKADSSCQTVTDALHANSAAWTMTPRVSYNTFSLEGAYTGEDGSSGLRMSQAVGCLLLAVAYASQ